MNIKWYIITKTRYSKLYKRISRHSPNNRNPPNTHTHNMLYLDRKKTTPIPKKHIHNNLSLGGKKNPPQKNNTIHTTTPIYQQTNIQHLAKLQPAKPTHKQIPSFGKHPATPIYKQVSNPKLQPTTPTH